MRKSKRIYVAEKDFVIGSPKIALNLAVRRRGLLKGKCWTVSERGIHVGPNYRYLNEFGLRKAPQIKLTTNGVNWMQTSTDPNHLTLIDSTGAYL